MTPSPSPNSSSKVSLIDLTAEDNCEIISSRSPASILHKFTVSPLSSSPILLKNEGLSSSSSSSSSSSETSTSIPLVTRILEDITVIRTVNIPVLKQPKKVIKKTLKPTRTPHPHTITLIPSDPKSSSTSALDRKCPICLDPLKDPSVTLCGHLYCTECIKSAAKSTRLCPICRTKLSPKSFHRIYL